jgi:hypothetical protein
MRTYDDFVRLARTGHELASTLDSKAAEWWKEHLTSGVKKLLSWVKEVNCTATCDVISDPLTRRRRGRPPTRRLKSMVERPSKKKVNVYSYFLKFINACFIH